MQFENRKWLLAAGVAGMISIGLSACHQGASSQGKAPASSRPAAAGKEIPPPLGWDDESPDSSKPSQAAFNPNQMCAGTDAIATIRGMIIEEAAKHVHGDLARQLLAKHGNDMIAIELITVASVDPTVKKANCRARLTVKMPPQLRDTIRRQAELNNITASRPGEYDNPPYLDARLLSHEPEAMTYSAQPTADGTDTVYTIDDVDGPAGAIAFVADVTANWLKTRQQSSSPPQQ